jgi:branched-chain amino acid transport system substrate-binding protein
MYDDEGLMDVESVFGDSVSRGVLLKRAFAAGAAIGLAPYIAVTDAFAQGRTLKLGYVTPRTGPLAGFGEADRFVINQMRRVFTRGLRIRGTRYPVQILDRDTQSNPNRAATVAQNLILDDDVDLILVAGTPETTNPVSDTCEANKVPCISSVAPWQPWFLGRRGDPQKPFRYTYHFFWGLEDIIGVFLRMWRQVQTNRGVGAIWPNDGDGNAWSDSRLGFPPPLRRAGYRIIDPGRYPNLSDDFSSQISRFRSGGAQIVTGVPLPPDFTTFWTQALQQGFRPRVASIGKAMLFPAAANALGRNGAGISTEVWWSPFHPYRSSLTRQTSTALATAYERSTDRQWTQPIGFAHALFEVAANALSRTRDLDNKEQIADAIKATRLDTIVGRVQWRGGPNANVAKTKLVGGQWRRGRRFRYELRIVENQAVPRVRRHGKLTPIPYR